MKLRIAILAYLRSLGQAFYLDQVLFGAFLLLWVALFQWQAFLFAFGASFLSFWLSYPKSISKILRDSGLIPVNAFFLGLALANHFQPSLALVLLVLLGAVAVPILTCAVFEITQHWRLSPYLLPYVLLYWMSELVVRGLPEQTRPELIEASFHGRDGGVTSFWDLSGHSLGSVLFMNQANFGLGLAALLLCFDFRRGFYFLSGAIVGALLLTVLGVPDSGLVFNAGLVGIALASFYERFHPKRIFLFIALAVFIGLGTREFLQTPRLEVLSLPYIFTLWIAQLSLEPRLVLGWKSVQK